MASIRRIDWSAKVREVVGSWLFSDLTDRGLPPVGLLPLENPDLHDHRGMCIKLCRAHSYRSATEGDYDGHRIAVFRSKFGGPAAALLVDSASDHGLRSLVAVGFCGSLVEDYRAGDIVAVSSGLGDDGVSDAYGLVRPPVPEPRM